MKMSVEAKRGSIFYERGPKGLSDATRGPQGRERARPGGPQRAVTITGGRRFGRRDARRRRRFWKKRYFSTCFHASEHYKLPYFI